MSQEIIHVQIFGVGVVSDKGLTLAGNSFQARNQRWLPLYEGKMLGMYDHRAASVVFNPDNAARRNVQRLTESVEYRNPSYAVQPLHWINEADVAGRCGGSVPPWMIVFKSITASTNERSFIASVVPGVATNDKVPWLRIDKDASLAACLLACLNAHPFDYIVRQKIAGVDLRAHYVRQLPAISADEFHQPCRWGSNDLSHWVCPRVAELSYTGFDLSAWAVACAYDGPPFRWDGERRFLIRCELDAAYFHLYGIERDDVDYIMETFPIVKRRDIARTEVKDNSGEVTQEGRYITKDTILEIYDEMAEVMAANKAAVATGHQPTARYQTRLNPPPGPPADAEGNFQPLPQWLSGQPQPSGWPSHIHPPRGVMDGAEPIGQVVMATDFSEGEWVRIIEALCDAASDRDLAFPDFLRIAKEARCDWEAVHVAVEKLSSGENPTWERVFVDANTGSALTERAVADRLRESLASTHRPDSVVPDWTKEVRVLWRLRR